MVTDPDIRKFIWVAGASFVANLVSVTAVVAWMNAPLKERVAKAEVRAILVEERIHDHAAIIGHPGMLELLKRIEIDVRWLVQQQREGGE